MMNKSWPVWVGGVIVLAILLTLGMWQLGPGPTKRNFSRLHVGMPVEEVEAIMGPPTENVDAATIPIPSHLKGEEAASYQKWKDETASVRKWYNSYYGFCGHFDKAGRLTYTAYWKLNDEFP